MLKMKWTIGALAMAGLLAGCGGAGGAASAAKSACTSMLEEGDNPFGDVDVKEVCSCTADKIKEEVEDDPDLAKPIMKAAKLMKDNPEGMDEDDISTSDMIGATTIQAAVKSCISE